MTSGSRAARLLQAGDAVGRGHDVEAVLAEVVGQRRGKARLVLDDEHGLGRVRRRFIVAGVS